MGSYAARRIICIFPVSFGYSKFLVLMANGLYFRDFLGVQNSMTYYDRGLDEKLWLD